ncbi:MAG: hypothetical protein QOJ13_2137 [Gaiellales bacterium]|jgi:hypothetical protein|nr:hypothetical protein [Gaiellales bacterium]MDX6592941.1 hypothetical protein [Gaiellales bacterium]
MTALMVIEQPRANSAQVEAWRLHVLLQAGYPLKVAERIARSTADLHQAVEMLEQGCTAHVAARILT